LIRVEVGQGNLTVRQTVDVGGSGRILLQARQGVVLREAVVGEADYLALVEGQRLSYTWPVTAGALAYSVEIRRDGILYDSPWVEEGNRWTSNVLPQGQYEISVTPYTAQGFEARSLPIDFHVDAGYPGSLEVVGPGPAGENAPLTFSWNPAADALWYHVQLRQGGLAVSDQWVWGQSSLTTGYSLAPGSYQWTITAYGRDGAGAGAQGALSVSAIWPASGAPDGTSVSGQPLTLSWNPVEAVRWYLVEVSRDGSALLTEWTSTGENARWLSSTLMPWGPYHWSVSYQTLQGEMAVAAQGALYLYA
jgi:hypothetical protein